MPDANEVAAGFGYSVAFFRSDPELSALLDRATSQTYTPQRFVAELQNTNWFRGKSEGYRKWLALVSTDPETAEARVAAAKEKIIALSMEMGAYVQPGEFENFANSMVALDWSEAELRSSLAARLLMEGGHFRGGAAAAAEQVVRQTLDDYGVTLDEGSIGFYVKSLVLGGTANQSAIKNWAMQQAASRYPPLADRIWAGETVKQIAAPYIQEQAKTLELSPESVGVNDPLIQRALASKDKDGKPASQTIWQFQQTLREDPRWMKTQNAQDSFMETGRKVLADFGLVS